MSRPDEPRTSASLLREVSASRSDAVWRRFLDRYQPLIWNWCGQWGLPPQEREEVTATVLLKLVREMPRFCYDARRSFRGWLKTVVDNAVKDLFRTWALKPGARGTGDSRVLEALQQIRDPGSISSLVQELDAHLGHDRRQMRQALARVRERVEPHTWQAFWLTAVEDRPGAEVGAKLGMRVTAVHMAKSRVSKMLRQEMARLERQGTASTGGRS
ncbi:MAG TPA: sigma-70 family RNA polymerase sigma factor [Gemmataceae bacterium]|jgi:RNA polymerase sigma-70 factor (ECF subfamily)|nr:sigma-70 family RNA polymerase sigma factor [Gemmataceae bacterium]